MLLPEGKRALVRSFSDIVRPRSSVGKCIRDVSYPRMVTYHYWGAFSSRFVVFIVVILLLLLYLVLTGRVTVFVNFKICVALPWGRIGMQDTMGYATTFDLDPPLY